MAIRKIYVRMFIYIIEDKRKMSKTTNICVMGELRPQDLHKKLVIIIKVTVISSSRWTPEKRKRQSCPEGNKHDRNDS